MILDWFVHHKRFGKFKAAFDRPTFTMRPLNDFPRVIHFYWDQGLSEAPPIIHECLQSWERQNPTWSIRSWDRRTAEELVSRASLPADLKTTPYSDILRTEILKHHGGVWADATIYCTRGLDQWLLPIMCQTDFFAFSRPGPDRAIASWFLAARRDSAVVADLSNAVGRFWAGQDKPTRSYHWFQYIFEYLERTSAAFRCEWQSAPRFAAVPMLLLQIRLLAGETFTAEDLEAVQAMPMHKLTHKREMDIAQVQSLLAE